MSNTTKKKSTFPILILLLFFSLSCISNSNAQHGKIQGEFKINPITPFITLFTPDPAYFLIGVEVGGKQTSIEIELFTEGSQVIANFFHGKFYTNPKFSLDRFYVGIFGGTFRVGDSEPSRDNFIGLELGYKWLTKRNFTIELAGGGFLNLSDTESGGPYFKTSVGYRFNKQEKE